MRNETNTNFNDYYYYYNVRKTLQLKKTVQSITPSH